MSLDVVNLWGLSARNARNGATVVPSADRVFTAMVVAVCAALLSPLLTYRMGLDQGIFAYIGAELLEGRLPYISTWDMAYPGLMFLQAGEIFLFGKSIAMFRLFDLLFQLGNAYLIYRITRRLSGRGGGYLAAATFCLIYQGYGTWNTAQREGFGLLFGLIGFWFYLTADRRRAVMTAAWIGLAMGLAFTIKPTLLAFAALYVPLLRRLDRKVVHVTLAGTAALATPIAIIVILYWTQGGLLQLYEASIAFHRDVYLPSQRGDDPLLLHWLSKLQQLGWQSVLVLALYPAFLLWGPSRRERLMLYVGYLGAIYAVFVQGVFGGYHYLPGLAIGSILVGTMFSQVCGTVLRDRSFQLGCFQIPAELVVAQVVILAALPFYVDLNRVRSDLLTFNFLDRPRPGEYRNSTVFDFTEDWNVAEYLQARTSPADRIQVWSHGSLVYYLADRDAASRFQNTTPLVMGVGRQEITPMQRRWWREFLRDMARNEPVYIAVVQHDHWWWAHEQRSSEEWLDVFPKWNGFIQDNYVLDHTIGRYLIYRRRAQMRDLALLNREQGYTP